MNRLLTSKWASKFWKKPIVLPALYNISSSDYAKLSQYTADRISGILMLYLAKDYKRINDIANKYNFSNDTIKSINPEIEGYISK